MDGPLRAVILVSDANHRDAPMTMRALYEFAILVVVDRRIGGVSRRHGFAMDTGCRRRAIQGLATAGAKHRYDVARGQR